MDVYAELLRSYDEGVAEFLDLERVKPNTLGNTPDAPHALTVERPLPAALSTGRERPRRVASRRGDNEGGLSTGGQARPEAA